MRLQLLRKRFLYIPEEAHLDAERSLQETNAYRYKLLTHYALRMTSDRDILDLLLTQRPEEAHIVDPENNMHLLLYTIFRAHYDEDQDFRNRGSIEQVFDLILERCGEHGIHSPLCRSKTRRQTW